MTQLKSVFDLKDLNGRQRYYPPGQHPAMARMRAHLTMARDLQEKRNRARAEHLVVLHAFRSERDLQGEELAEFITYLEGQLAAFEEVESERKQRDDWVLRAERGEV